MRELRKISQRKGRVFWEAHSLRFFNDCEFTYFYKQKKSLISNAGLFFLGKCAVAPWNERVIFEMERLLKRLDGGRKKKMRRREKSVPIFPPSSSKCLFRMLMPLLLQSTPWAKLLLGLVAK